MYIGLTHASLNKRCGLNGGGYKKQPIFYHAIQKYGWDNFTHEILFDGLSKEEAQILEQIQIALYESTDRNKGYNMQIGGECTQLGRKFPGKKSETQFKKGNIPWNKGKNVLSEAQINENITRLAKFNKGKKHSDEWKQKISKSHKKKPVDRYDLEGNYIDSFESCKIASILTGVSYSGVGACAGGKRKTAGGYVWKFREGR